MWGAKLMDTLDVSREALHDCATLCLAQSAPRELVEYGVAERCQVLRATQLPDTPASLLLRAPSLKKRSDMGCRPVSVGGLQAPRNCTRSTVTHCLSLGR